MIVRLLTRSLTCSFLVVSLSAQAIGDPWSDVFESISARDELGAIGEQLVNDFYPATEPTGTINLLPKLDPLRPGPDRLVKLPDGVIKMHEVKTSLADWPGRGALRTEVLLDGVKRPVQQLDDQWIDAWAQRILGAGDAATEEERLAVAEVLRAREEGKLVRVFDEIHGVDGKIRSSFVRPGPDGSLVFEEKMGPFSLKRYLKRLADYRQRYQELRNGRRLGQALLKDPKATPVSESALRTKGTEAYADLDEFAKYPEKKIVPGLLGEDGRLWVGLKAGAIEGGLVFLVDAGIAGYRHTRGDTLRADFLTEVSDAAIKGGAVGTATAVVVILVPSGPSGWILAGVGIGATMFTDKVLCTWHEHEDLKHVSLEDLRGFGIDLHSVFEQGGSLLPATEPLIPRSTLLPETSVFDFRKN